eukprot:TRINITY_DN3315_c0_g3_i2.p2 TRINITY_DN3315_c0_g3~~TRINITY_DN3315_c0_g3_i2.p2  ORF type:complete len:243 (+),score=46.30 TRINITY_DN3315_c0_g3_i2:75-803(+)
MGNLPCFEGLSGGQARNPMLVQQQQGYGGGYPPQQQYYGGSPQQKGYCAAPVEPHLAQQFLEAVWAEYVEGRPQAAGRFLDQQPEHVQRALCPLEDMVRESGDPPRSISQLASQWGMPAPQQQGYYGGPQQGYPQQGYVQQGYDGGYQPGYMQPGFDAPQQQQQQQSGGGFGMGAMAGAALGGLAVGGLLGGLAEYELGGGNRDAGANGFDAPPPDGFDGPRTDGVDCPPPDGFDGGADGFD